MKRLIPYLVLLCLPLRAIAFWGPGGMADGMGVGPGGAGTWLAGWDQRIKITIDSSVVDGTLTNFPVKVKISTASGIGGSNNTAVFDEVGANSLKIAVTANDGITELYAEIEKWDNAASTNAWVWFKAPLIPNGADTNFYLYYDNDHADNTAYVGTTGTAVATNTWNSGYVGVYHIAETGTITRLDATKFDNNGTPQNYDGDEDIAAGQIDGADSLDGATDYMEIHSITSQLASSTVGTVSGWMKPTSDDGAASYMFAISEASINTFCGIFLDFGVGDDHISFVLTVDGSTAIRIDTAADTTDPLIGKWFHVAVTQDDVAAKLYTNGVLAVTETTGDKDWWFQRLITVATTKATTMDIGYVPFFGGYMNGAVDEIRFSTTYYPAAWIKAEYHSGTNSFVTYGPEETP